MGQAYSRQSYAVQVQVVSDSRRYSLASGPASVQLMEILNLRRRDLTDDQKADKKPRRSASHVGQPVVHTIN
jgi:hypothetical protein